MEIGVERVQSACLRYPTERWLQNQLVKDRGEVKYEAKNRLLEAECDTIKASTSTAYTQGTGKI